MSFIFILLILAIFIILLIPAFLFSAIRTILSMLGFLFTGKRRRSSSSHTSSYGGTGSFYGQASTGDDVKPHSSAQRKKMFEKDEGEYVDFEEIKEDK